MGIMKTQENMRKIESVATTTEIALISMDYRMNIDLYNTQKGDQRDSIISFFEPMVRDIMQKIQSETHKRYGASGMVMVSQILPAMGLELNNPLINN